MVIDLKRLTIAAVLMLLLGALLAHFTQTAGGTVEIQDLRFAGVTSGKMLSAHLYIPKEVTRDRPVPAIVAIHGYINSRETQAGFAIEFARRGFVVLALDQTGHGYSAPPAFAEGFGGPDALSYLYTLDLVDDERIGLEGHSMGGWASLATAAAHEGDYEAIVLVGSSTGSFGTAEGTATFPRNLALIFSRWDEFSGLMWGAEIPSEIVTTDKLRTLFATGSAVQVGRLYGSVEEGTARKLYMPAVTHPGDHLSREAIGNAVEWFQLTLEHGTQLPPEDQIWYWKELGTLLCFTGLVMLIFPLGGWLLSLPLFKELKEPMPEIIADRGWRWWMTALVSIAIPVLTFFKLQELGNQLIPANRFWPQNITTGIMAWALGSGLISLLLCLVWHFASKRRHTANGDHYGLTWERNFSARKIGKSALLALIVVSVLYQVLMLAGWLFNIDFRFWVVALKLMSVLHLRIFLAYLIPFTLAFLIAGVALNTQLRLTDRQGGDVTSRKAMVINALLLCIGFVFLLIVQYVPLLLGGTLAIPGQPLLTIVAIQFVPLLAITALVSTYFYRHTGHAYVGAFCNGLFITWYIVAGQATHVA
jgi:pimeloyl-ACP methyl ester carboxylesterase|tara:strand:- start:22 stop:1791 length:1770 start_codon:yes stop_codon:yes gene_type:complete